jgi:hypothetical protein
MDLVTLTDRDTIDGCLAYLDRNPGAEHFFVSEEITARDPGTGRRLAVLVYDISEERHRELQRLRGDVRDLAAYLRSERITASVGSVVAALPVETLPSADVRRLVDLFDRFELVNGAASRAHNRMVSRLVHEAAGGRPFGVTAGSGGSGPDRAGLTSTAARAADRAEFLAELGRGRTWAAGEAGSLWTASRDWVGAMRDDPRQAFEAAPRLIGQALRRIHHDARLRAARRRLDRADLHGFRRRADVLSSAVVSADHESGDPIRRIASPAPHDRSQRWA